MSNCGITGLHTIISLVGGTSYFVICLYITVLLDFSQVAKILIQKGKSDGELKDIETEGGRRGAIFLYDIEHG